MSGLITLLRELFAFLKQEKKWWLIPLAVMALLAVLALLLLVSSPGISSTLYPSK